MEERTSTYHRFQRAGEVLRQRLESSGRVGMDDLRTLLQDHNSHPNSICRHQEEHLPESGRYETVASVLMDVHAGQLPVPQGPPCQ